MVLKKWTKLLFVLLIAMFACARCERAVFAGELNVDIKFPVLPVLTGLTQKIEITMSPVTADGKQHEAVIEAKSGWGVLLFPSGPSGSGTASCSPGIPLQLEYRWAGAPPVNAPASERITVEIAELGVRGEAEFQIGMDLTVIGMDLPDAVTAGTFNPLEIILQDTFNPSLDVSSILDLLRISPEISLSLESDESSVQVPIRNDPVAERFFEDDGAKSIAAYPSEKLKPGSLITNSDGRAAWRSEEGRPPGITPPFGGAFHVEVMLKSNAGGIPLKYWTSPSFVVSGERPLGAGMPELLASSLGILARFDGSEASSAEKSAGELLERGDEKGAISEIGMSMGRVFSGSRLPSLGRYAAALSASGGSGDEIADFLSQFVKGFGDCGVLLVSKAGLAGWSAENGTVYEGKRLLSIPFTSGENVKVSLTGSDDGAVSLWKIIPDGVNRK